jgi:hypothetical protein
MSDKAVEPDSKNSEVSKRSFGKAAVSVSDPPDRLLERA